MPTRKKPDPVDACGNSLPTETRSVNWALAKFAADPTYGPVVPQAVFRFEPGEAERSGDFVCFNTRKRPLLITALISNPRLPQELAAPSFGDGGFSLRALYPRYRIYAR